MEAVSARTIGNGRYALGEALGHGGSGQVFRARRFPDAQEVAAKVIPIRDADEPVALLGRYRQIAQLEHPHILPILDVGISEDVLFVISPLASGGNLRQLVQRGQLEAHAVVGMVGQIADALRKDRYLHFRRSRVAGLGRVCLDHFRLAFGRNRHRLSFLLTVSSAAGPLTKPVPFWRESIKLLYDHPLLADFSLMQPVSGPAGRSRVRGTPAYMAPEQCTLGPLGPATDQYALGVTTFELLTGQKPFVGESPREMLRRQVCEPPPSPTSVNPALPREVDGVLLTALAKAPHHRYPDLAAFVVALTNALAHSPSVAPAPGLARAADRTLDAITLELEPSASRQRL